MENRVDPAITGSSVYFASRSPDPTSYIEGVTEPTGWNRDAIRTQWKETLYWWAQ